MLQFFQGWWNLKWTRSQPLFHPLPSNSNRDFVQTPLGLIELLVCQPPFQFPKQKPVLFVHGGFGHASVWLEWMTYLSQHYNARTYAVSVRNHGASYVCSSFARMVYRTSLDDLASDVVAAINEVESREGVSPILVSHSAGGALVQFILANGMAKTPALALTGVVPHYGFMLPAWNWFKRIDWWMFLRGMFMFHHPRAALCTTTLVRNAFFGPDYPFEKVKEFEKWMAPYEALGWPTGTMGNWKDGRNVWLDPNKIVRNITTEDSSRDRVLVMLGSEDKIMQGTQNRMAVEYAEATKELGKGARCGEKQQASIGVRLIEIDGAGHHLQNDGQWEEGAGALSGFLKQV